MFIDRKEAGKLLARKVADNVPSDPMVDQFVIGVGRGGILVAEPIANALYAPLSALASETIKDVEGSETEIAAVSSSGFVVYDEKLRCKMHEHSYLGHCVRDLSHQARESQRMWLMLAGLDTRPSLAGKRVIAVLEGVFTEMTSLAAAATIRQLGAAEVILATPIVTKKTKKRLEDVYDIVIALATPSKVKSIDEYYDEYHEVKDEEVIQTLAKAAILQKLAV